MQQQKNIINNNSFFSIDSLISFCTTLCIIDCSILPVTIVLFPFFEAFSSAQWIHSIVLFLVLPFSFISLSLGFYKHRKKYIIGLGLLGIGLLFFSHIIPSLEHTFWGSVISLLGSFILLFSQFQNRKQCHCHCHDH